MACWMVVDAKEIANLEKNTTWIETDVSSTKSLFSHGTWVFKHKRTPVGVVSKHKTQFIKLVLCILLSSAERWVCSVHAVAKGGVES